VQVKGNRAAGELRVPHHERTRRYHEQERSHAETRVHKASKTGQSRLGRIAGGIRRRRPVRLVPVPVPVSTRVIVIGRCGGDGARQVERGASKRVMNFDIHVRVRRLWWRATERPDDGLHSVRRGLHRESEMRQSEKNRILGASKRIPVLPGKKILTGQVNAICGLSPVT